MTFMTCALILAGICAATFFGLTYVIPGFSIKNNSTRIMLTALYFIVSCFIAVAVSGVSYLALKFFPGFTTMINMTAGFIITFFVSYKLLVIAEKAINNVKVGRGGVDYVVKSTVSGLLGTASAAGYFLLPFIMK